MNRQIHGNITVINASFRHLVVVSVDYIYTQCTFLVCHLSRPFEVWSTHKVPIAIELGRGGSFLPWGVLSTLISSRHDTLITLV